MKLVLIMCAMLMVSSAYAQNVNLGVKGGFNFSNAYNNNSSNEVKLGLHLGVLWHIHKSENFAVQPEIMYSMQGAKLSNDTKLTLGYINVPVLFQFMFNNGFRLQAGPQIGFLAHAKSELRSNSDDVKNNFKPIDIALAFGMGYITSTGLGFDARYNYGITNINDQGDDDITNRVLQVGVFYLLNHQ